MSSLKTELKGLINLTKSKSRAMNFISTQGRQIFPVLTYFCHLN